MVSLGLKEIAHRAKRRILLGFSPRVHLDKKTVLVNPDSWTLFQKQTFSSNETDVCRAYIEQIASSDFEKIVGYVGVIDKKFLPKLKNLHWLQLASHGFNGFDNRNLYTSPKIVVSNLKNVFA